MKKKIVAVVLTVILSAVWGAAYYRANQTPLQADTEYYNKGEIVDIGMNFFDSASENPKGYKLQICSAKVKSIESFLEEQRQPTDIIPLVDEYGYPRPDYVCDLELKIINGNNADGYVLISRYFLADGALTLEMNYDLWSILYPEMEGAVAVTLDKNEEMSIHIPFTASPRSQRRYTERVNQRLPHSKFALCVSEYPVRKMLEIR